MSTGQRHRALINPKGMGKKFMEQYSFNEIQIHYTVKRIGPQVSTSEGIYRILLENWPDVDYCERFCVVLLNRSNNILGIKQISEGSVSGTVADPKKIFQIALAANAAGVILAHNHPSGNTQPSASDKLITNECKQAGAFLKLPVLDHIIVTRQGYYSFADQGHL